MVLSFGEVLMDCLPTGNVIGGAPFNVVIHLKRMGEESAIISKIGKDELGDEILDFLVKENVDSKIQIDHSYKTGYVTVRLENGQPSYTIHRNTGWEFVDYKENRDQPDYFVFGSLALHFPHNKASFLEYKKQYPNAIGLCDINLRAPFYDKETIEFCFNNCDILKINDEELAYFAKENNTDNPMKLLNDKFGISKVILTKGADGADVIWDGEVFSAKAGTVNDLKDTVGAGDSFTSMFIYGLLKGISVQENLERASTFAASICEQNGAIPSDKSIYDSYRL